LNQWKSWFIYIYIFFSRTLTCRALRLGCARSGGRATMTPQSTFIKWR
jgi:hypothetical protein